MALCAFRDTPEEKRFVDAWTRTRSLTAAAQASAAHYHEATFAGWNRAAVLFTSLKKVLVRPLDELMPVEDPTASLVEGYFWAFLQSSKGTLDSLGREMNLVYWHLEEGDQFFDPGHNPRWVSFYTVRQKLQSRDWTYSDPAAELLRTRTAGDTADPPYKSLSHLSNEAVSKPLRVGPIVALMGKEHGTLRVEDCRVFVPDDSQMDPPSYDLGYEVNETGREILSWLCQFMDAVYGSLVESLKPLHS